MNKQPNIKNLTKEEKMKDAFDKAVMILTVISAVLVVELFGVVVHHIFNLQSHGFIYNFFLGFGIITLIAFVFTGIQEVFEK